MWTKTKYNTKGHQVAVWISCANWVGLLVSSAHIYGHTRQVCHWSVNFIGFATYHQQLIQQCISMSMHKISQGYHRSDSPTPFLINNQVSTMHAFKNYPKLIKPSHLQLWRQQHHLLLYAGWLVMPPLLSQVRIWSYETRPAHLLLSPQPYEVTR